MTISFTAEESESRSIPLEIEPITRAPSKAVQTEPRPPKRLVPAITGPAIALAGAVVGAVAIRSKKRGDELSVEAAEANVNPGGSALAAEERELAAAGERV